MLESKRGEDYSSSGLRTTQNTHIEAARYLTEGRFSAQEASLYARQNDERDLAVKITQLLDAPELRATMGRAGRRRIEHELEWKYETPKLLAAYATVFAPGKAPEEPP